jgi:hypothetical protein
MVDQSAAGSVIALSSYRTHGTSLSDSLTYLLLPSHGDEKPDPKYSSSTTAFPNSSTAQSSPCKPQYDRIVYTDWIFRSISEKALVQDTDGATLNHIEEIVPEELGLSEKDWPRFEFMVDVLSRYKWTKNKASFTEATDKFLRGIEVDNEVSFMSSSGQRSLVYLGAIMLDLGPSFMLTSCPPSCLRTCLLPLEEHC